MTKIEVKIYMTNPITATLFINGIPKITKPFKHLHEAESWMKIKEQQRTTFIF